MPSKSVFALFALSMGLLPLSCGGDDAPDSGAATGRDGAAGAAQGGAAGAAGSSGGQGASAGTGTAGGPPGDERLFVPEDLPTEELNAEGGLTLVALTLTSGQRGPQLFAAVRNDGETPACEAGMTVNFKDADDQVVATGAGTLLSGRYYRTDGGSGAVISCVAPRQIAMTAMAELPATLVIGELGSLEYTFPAFDVPGIVELEGLQVSEVQAVMTASGYAFTGTVTNDLTETLSDVKATVFALNAVGRPLGAGSSSAMSALAPSDSWSFQTSGFNQLGVGHAGFVSATYPF